MQPWVHMDNGHVTHWCEWQQLFEILPQKNHTTEKKQKKRQNSCLNSRPATVYTFTLPVVMLHHCCGPMLQQCLSQGFSVKLSYVQRLWYCTNHLLKIFPLVLQTITTADTYICWRDNDLTVIVQCLQSHAEASIPWAVTPVRKYMRVSSPLKY